MGVYVYTLKKSKSKSVIIDGVKKMVAVFTYLCRADQLGKCHEGRAEEYHLPPFDKYVDRAEDKAEGFEADLMVFAPDNGSVDGCMAYKYNGGGSFYDDYHRNEMVGTITKEGRGKYSMK